MRNKAKILILFLIFATLCMIAYWFFEISKFASGIKDDTLKRDSVLKENGIRLDSMGTVKYEDYQKSKDSLEMPNK